MKKLFEVFLSFFGFGYSPVAPGTVGSLAALFLVYIFAVSPHPLISLSLSFFLIFVAALFVINLYFEEFKPTKHDPGWIVIDEVLGILLCFMIIWGMQGVHSHLILVLSIGFATFRFFDIVKVRLLVFLIKDNRLMILFLMT